MGEALSVPTLAYFTGQLFEKTTGLGPTDAHFYINFRPPTYANDQNVLFSYPVFSIAKILSKNLPQKEKDALKGALVLVGSTALINTLKSSNDPAVIVNDLAQTREIEIEKLDEFFRRHFF